MPFFGSWNAAEKITATFPVGTLTAVDCGVVGCVLGCAAVTCANPEPAAIRTKNAVIKIFLCMMYTSNGESKARRAEYVHVLLLALCPLQLNLTLESSMPR